ncbi:hypothetical protein [Blastomonas sp.]|uniref:hypothetical protein n=1 Tax=Blastomonas sp. TaxID=1909299 RepID=UPI00359469A7
MHDELQPSGTEQKSSQSQARALVGWTHFDMASGIGLKIECTRSRIALDNAVIEEHNIVMTRNQALLLARYLLHVTGQALPVEQQKSIWSKLKASFKPRHARRLAS